MPASPRHLLSLLAAHLARHNLPAPQGASPDELALMVQAIGFTPPQDLLQWLSMYRGGNVDLHSASSLYGTARDFSIVSELRLDPRMKERRWLALANDGCGDLFCLVCGDHPAAPAPVIFHDHEDGSTYLAASGLLPFLEIVLTEPEYDDDPDYTSVYLDRDRFFKADPAAAHICGFPYGWEN